VTQNPFVFHGEFAGFRLSGEIYSLLFRSLDFFVSFFIKKKRKENGAALLYIPCLNEILEIVFY